MKLKRLQALLAFLFFIAKMGMAQDTSLPPIPADYYRNPLDISLYLAGNFGEIRSNHFHSGLDIKTNQREGYPVYAVADGYVSRLRVQVGGFGNALYIDHPNGTTSVYAHLQRFSPEIAARVKAMQYEQKSFAVDFMLTPIEIRLKQGDLIAYSGNTGSSGGPHLHFELRNTKTEETINPILLGIKIKDTLKPQLNALYLYKTNKYSFTESTPKQYFAVSGGNGNYTLGNIGVIQVNGEFGFGISAFDQQNGSANHNGIYSTVLKLDGETIFESIIDRFAFENSRAVNAYIDYPSKISSGRVIQKSFLSANPKVRFVKKASNNGFIQLKDQNVHDVEYVVSDIEGNSSVLRFKVKNNPALPLYQAKNTGQLMFWDKENKLENENIKMILPSGILYDHLYFDYAEKAKPSWGASKIFQLHNRLTPLHSNYSLAIKVDSSQLANTDKLIIFQQESGSQGGVFKDGYMWAQPKTFGNFYLRADVTPPSIVPLNIKEGANLSTQSNIAFKISDALSGIKSFNLYIDNQWVLAEFDVRNGRLWHTFDEKTGFGKHLLKLVVTDMKDNEKTYDITFYR